MGIHLLQVERCTNNRPLGSSPVQSPECPSPESHAFLDDTEHFFNYHLALPHEFRIGWFHQSSMIAREGRMVREQTYSSANPLRPAAFPSLGAFLVSLAYIHATRTFLRIVDMENDLIVANDMVVINIVP